MEFFFSKLQACELQPSALRVFKTPEITSHVVFCLHKQVLTGSLQNSCSKQQLKLPEWPANAFKKRPTIGVLLSSFKSMLMSTKYQKEYCVLFLTSMFYFLIKNLAR